MWSVVWPCDAGRCGAAMIRGTLVPTSNRVFFVQRPCLCGQQRFASAKLCRGKEHADGLLHSLSQVPAAAANRHSRSASEATTEATDQWSQACRAQRNAHWSPWKTTTVSATMVLPSSSTRSSSRPTCSSIKLTAASAIKPPTERQKCQRTDNSKPSAEFSLEAKIRRNSRFIVLWQQRTISVAQEGGRRRLERTER